jgi:hypothetical protein
VVGPPHSLPRDSQHRSAKPGPKPAIIRILQCASVMDSHHRGPDLSVGQEYSSPSRVRQVKNVTCIVSLDTERNCLQEWSFL